MMLRKIIAFIFLLLSTSARADVSALFNYKIEQAENLSFVNTLTITNNTVDQNIWAVDLTAEGIMISQFPDNWDAFRADSTDLNFYSLTEGAPPVGSDLPPGESITFIFSFTTQPAEIPFTVQFLNSNFVNTDLFGTLKSDGSILIPEPSTLWILGIGFILLLKRGTAHATAISR